MAVVINDFEITPQTTADENKRDGKKTEKGNSEKPEMSDHEIKQLLDRRAERLERVSAH